MATALSGPACRTHMVAPATLCSLMIVSMLTEYTERKYTRVRCGDDGVWIKVPGLVVLQQRYYYYLLSTW